MKQPQRGLEKRVAAQAPHPRVSGLLSGVFVNTLQQNPKHSASSPEHLSWLRVDLRGWVVCAVIAVAALAAYSCTFSAPLVFDDIPAIAENASIRHWRTALWAPIDTTAGGRPMVNLSLAINYAVSGYKVWSYHAFNLATHVLAGWTLYGILRRTLAAWFGPAATTTAFSASLLWTLHPLQTESVTYVVQRAESLMGLCYLLTLYCFIRGAESYRVASRRWFTLCVGACLLGMATKEVMVSAPLVLLLYDRTFLAGSFEEAWRRRWKVYGGLGATWIVLSALVALSQGRSSSAGVGYGVSLGAYLPTQFPAILRYLKLSLWPFPLVFYYGTEWEKSFRAVLMPAVAVTGLAAMTLWALFRSGRNARAMGFAGAWFFAILAPTSLVPIVRQTAAEHRMYLALIPVLVVFVISIHRWLRVWALPACLLLAGVLLAITFHRNGDYASTQKLWADTVAKCPENPYAHYNLGNALVGGAKKWDEAIVQFREALRLKPDYVDARINLGIALTEQRRIPEAIAELESAIQFRPASAEAHNGLGNALIVGNRVADAAKQYEEAIQLKPEYAQAHYNLGNAMLMLGGRLNDAIAQFQEALRLQPDFLQAHFNLAMVLLKVAGRLDEAEAHLTAVLRLQPENQVARKILARLRTFHPVNP